MDILEALSALDTDNAEDWTKDGLPKTEAASELVGETVTRAQITEVAPLFTKDNPVLEVTDPEPEVPAEPGTDPDASTDDGDETGDDDTDQDEDDEDQDNEDSDDEDADDDVPVLAGRLGKAHPEVQETAADLEKAAKAVREAQEWHRRATAAHSKAVQKHSPLTHTPEENQKGIMSHIEAGLKRKEQKFEEAKAVNAAIQSIGNPIDRANRKPEHRGHGNLHSRGQTVTE